jgi:hypothetical protein
MFLLVSASTIQAAAKITIAPTEQTHAMISAGSVLQHNKHLLHNTTIGEGLKISSTQRVKDLYKMAHDFFLEATDAHKSGLERKAKELAHKSISFFYEADKAHYNLSKRY